MPVSTTKVSIIVPVHNGVKYLDKTVKILLQQDYGNFEVLLIENNSSDDSWKKCQELQSKDKRIRAFSVDTKGTTLARKYGVLQADGTYITFHDQDDKYVNSHAVSKMVQAIREDNADICQFGYIKTLLGISKKVPKPVSNPIVIFDRQQIMDYQIKGILGFGWNPDIVLGTQVWNKIYRADILKDAVKNINESLYFCEDVYLNMFAFFHEDTEKVSVRNEYYYQWKAGIGFSSSDKARMTFLKDYQYIKGASIPLIRKYSSDIVFYQAHWDSLTVYKWAIYSMLYDRISREEIIKSIKEIERYAYIQEAKTELGKLSDPPSYFRDITFLTSDYSADDYYDYCVSTLPTRSKVAFFKDSFKKVMAHLTKHA